MSGYWREEKEKRSEGSPRAFFILLIVLSVELCVYCLLNGKGSPAAVSFAYVYANVYV